MIIVTIKNIKKTRSQPPAQRDRSCNLIKRFLVLGSQFRTWDGGIIEILGVLKAHQDHHY